VHAQAVVGHAAAPTPYRSTPSGGVWQDFPNRSDEHAMPHGALLFSIGGTSITTYRVAVGSSQLVREGEGSSSGGATGSVHYHYPIIPFLSVRGFFRIGGFVTDLSEGGGYEYHTLYRPGVAPALSFAVVPRKHQSVHLVFSLPIGLVIGTQPGNPPRDAVEEDVNVGTGYRIGGALGMLAVLSEHAGVTLDLEIARDDLFHRVTYRALDGRSPPRELNLHYRLWSLDLTIGAVWAI
jgi:hypothetical protein